MIAISTPYTYRVIEIIRTVDGDTIDCRIDMGFGIHASFRFRLAHIDTAEVYGRQSSARGTEASNFTRGWLASHGDNLFVRTFKAHGQSVGIGDGAFGRWLAAFFTPDGQDLASALTDAGHA